MIGYKKAIILISIFLVLIIGLIVYINKDKIYDETIKTEDSSSILKDTNMDGELDFSNYERHEIKLSDSYIINSSGVYHFTGTISNGGIIVNTKEDVKIVLDNVSITNTNNPAINVIKARNLYIELVGDNRLKATTQADLGGCIYSKADLLIFGSGSLTLTSNYDGIVSKDNLIIKSGTYIITTNGDGIKSKDSLVIYDGTFNLNTKDDSIHSSGSIVINDGEFKINSNDDAIHADEMIEINDATIDITAHEGIEASYVKINGGSINISASDDGINATNSSNEHTATIEINGGHIIVKMGSGDTDAIDSNGNLYINGGTIDITATSPFDYDKEAKYTGGTIIVNGITTNQITNQIIVGAKQNN